MLTATTSRACGGRVSMMCCSQAMLLVGQLEYFAMELTLSDSEDRMVVLSIEQNSVETFRCVPAMRRTFVDMIQRLRRRERAQHLDCKSFDTSLVSYKDDASDEVREQRAVIRFFPTKDDTDCLDWTRGWKVHLCFLCLPCQPTTKFSAC